MVHHHRLSLSINQVTLSCDHQKMRVCGFGSKYSEAATTPAAATGTSSAAGGPAVTTLAASSDMWRKSESENQELKTKVKVKADTVTSEAGCPAESTLAAS